MNERTFTVISVRSLADSVTVPNMRGSASCATTLLNPKKKDPTSTQNAGRGVVPSWVYRRHFSVLRPRHAYYLSLSCLALLLPVSIPRTVAGALVVVAVLVVVAHAAAAGSATVVVVTVLSLIVGVLGRRRPVICSPVFCFPSRGVSWGGVCRYKMFTLLVG